MRTLRNGVVPAVLLAAAFLSDRPAHAQLIAERLATGLSQPVLAIAPPGDTERIFIVEQRGFIRIFKDCEVLATPFLDIDTKVQSGGEQGLLGLAFHPDYANNGLFYVNYTRNGGQTMIEQYSVSAGDPDIADVASGVVIAGPINQPQSNHNGGMIAFGGDGKLYVGMGDGGNFNDTGPGHATGGNAQSGSTLLGKMLRYDVDIPFPHIPPDNPFVSDPNILDEIWAFGVRNPWRFSFDRDTGDCYIADVGQNAWEEVHFEAAGNGGLNYGWRCMEGFNCTGLSGCTCNAPTLTLPIEEYSHGLGCSITGGYMYRGSIASIQGQYFYGDFCSSRIWSFTYDGVTKGPTIDRTAELEPPIGTISQISGFGETGDGELLILDYADGELYIVNDEPITDCNNNGVSDECDIAVGTSTDGNNNGIPDECELTSYCTAKTGLSCGTPAMFWNGSPSASQTSGFTLIGFPARGQRSGLVLYTDAGRLAIPFQGGTLCVLSPSRTVPVNSGGSASGCDGFFVIDMNAYSQGILGGTPQSYLLVPGTQVNTQWWGRDTVSTGSFLTDAVEYFVGF